MHVRVHCLGAVQTARCEVILVEGKHSMYASTLVGWIQVEG